LTQYKLYTWYHTSGHPWSNIFNLEIKKWKVKRMGSFTKKTFQTRTNYLSHHHRNCKGIEICTEIYFDTFKKVLKLLHTHPKVIRILLFYIEWIPYFVHFRTVNHRSNGCFCSSDFFDSKI
jgi:hypothetical protein